MNIYIEQAKLQSNINEHTDEECSQDCFVNQMLDSICRNLVYLFNVFKM